MHDLILSPTRQIVGIEDPFLRLPDAPSYFDAAWRARSLLADAGGRPPIATRWRSSSTPPSNETRTNSTSTLVAFFQPFNGPSQQPRPGSRSRIGPNSPQSSHISCFRGCGSGEPTLRKSPIPARGRPVCRQGSRHGQTNDHGRGGSRGGRRRISDSRFLLGAPHSWWSVGDNELIGPHCPTDAGRICCHFMTAE